MGKCVSTVDQKQELKRTAYYENKPLDRKINEDDYQFLQYPTILKEENGSSNKKDASVESPKRPRHNKKTDGKEQKQESNPPNIGLEDPICNPLAADEGDHEMLNPYNTKSAIIKLSKRASIGKKKGQKEQDNEPQTSKNKDNDIIEAVLTNQTIVSSLIFTHGDVNMEFALSRCRAGPLTVPCIIYDHYNIS